MSSNEQIKLGSTGSSESLRPADGLRSGLCFGREHELAELSALAEQSITDGVGRLVVVEGEAGIGKSRLGAALETRLVGLGIAVLSGRCRDGVHHAATYRPFVEILGGAIAALDDSGEAGIAERGREVRDVLAGRASAARQGADWAERRAALFDTVTGFLVDASRRLKLTIVVHDIDAADLATRELVAHVAASSIPAAPLAPDAPAERLRGALVVTARTFDESLLSGTSATVIRLQPLDQDGVRAFLNTPEVVAFFAEATGGRPRALEALLEAAPLDADDLLRTRWERLGSAERQLIGALAVAGRPMSLVDLGTLVGDTLVEMSGAQLTLAAQELQAARLCRREVKRGDIVLSLYSRTDEETLYGLIPEPMLAPLHLAIGKWLATRGGDELLDRVRIAEHLLRGGAGSAAVESAVRAVDALELTYGYDRAVDLLRRARTAALGLHLEADVSDNIVAGLDVRLCELERLVGDYDAALATAQRIERRAPDAAASRRIAALHVLRDELDQALAALDTAAQLAADDDDEEHARIAAARAEALYVAGRTVEAKRSAEAALSRAHGSEGHDARARALEVHNTLGKVALAETRYADAAAIFGNNIAPARSMGNAFEEARALFNLGIAELRLGDHTQAQARYQMALEIAESAGDHRNRAFCLQNLAVLAHWRGDYAQALTQFQAAVAAFRRTGSRVRLAWVALDLASVYVDLNDIEGARATASLVSQLSSVGLPLEVVIKRTVLDGCIALMSGDNASARELFLHAQQAAAGKQPERLLEASQQLVRLDLDEGDLDGAQRALDALPRSNSDRTQVRSDLLRAELYVARRRGLEARRLLRDVLAVAQRLADLETEWRALHFMGKAAQLMRDQAEADRRFAAAASVDRRLRERVPTAQRAGFDDIALRRAMGRAAGLPQVVALPVPPRPRPRLVEDAPAAAPLLGRIVGQHPRIRQVCSMVERVAPAESMVLIRGESGTGKELVAEALHLLSPRRDRPFVKVNCGAIVETLLLSELFGHERGAFTGAMQRKKGRFEVADGGTIFLDEIGDISPHTQVALLRVLQERQFERVGGTTPVHVDVRILCATHRNLEAMVARGEFREDLYYRLRGIQIELPALRERPTDVLLIAQSLLEATAAQRGHKPLKLTPEAAAMLTAHAWPGNVRELENVLRSAALFAENGHIDAPDLAELLSVRREHPVTLSVAPDPAAPTPPREVPSGVDPGELAWQRLAAENLSLKELKVRVEVECIQRALALCKGNITRAAAKLGMKRPRLSQLVKEHGLRLDAYGDQLPDDTEVLTEENS